ncbi:DNA polymerase III subunit gamma/tau [Candidatus Saccharibacteria bacterium]|nr:DNA polymerase III subunit gamma/tau [Candidatus Saccharibacteria bacterium]
MKALYRRYRPRSLDEVVGQPQITDILSHSIKNGKISHAYLFIGPRGTGKTSVARILAHEINGFKYELEDDYLDIIEIDAASNTGVDNIRDLRERAIIAPTKGKYKVYIIDEVHMLSKSAFNALLKTLEEPPEHVIFIMATTDAHKVPVTITSRSQVFTFKLADPSTMLEHLKNICKKEKIDIDDEALKIVVKRGGGSFRDSLSLLDQVSTLSDGKITAELLNESLGLPQDELVEKLLTAYASADTTTVNQTLRELLDSGVKAEIIAAELIDRILEKPEPAYLPLLDKLTDVSRNAHPNAKLLLAFYREQAAAPRIVAPAPAPQKAAPTPTAPKAAPAKTKEESKPEPAPAKVTIVATGSSGEEIWRKVLENVRENAPMELSNFEKAHYCLNGTTFEVHATNAFIRKRLDTKRSLITSVLPESYTILISDQPLAVDPDIANIMDAIGGGEEIEIDE